MDMPVDVPVGVAVGVDVDVDVGVGTHVATEGSLDRDTVVTYVLVATTAVCSV